MIFLTQNKIKLNYQKLTFCKFIKPFCPADAFSQLIVILILKNFENCPTITILRDYHFLKDLDTDGTENNKVFALILTRHRLWGAVLVPYIIVNEANRTYFRLAEALSPFPNINTLSALVPEERDTVNILNEYTDRKLFSLFSKDNTVKEFLQKVTQEKIDNSIRPYIESHIHKCLAIARDEAIPVFLRKSKINTMHLEDQLFISGDTAHPVFRFTRGDEQSTYSLSIGLAGDLINLRNDDIEIICMSPCLIRVANNLIFVADVDGSKLKPFMTRENVVIPKKAEIRYFESFVLNAVNNFRVEGSGFEIVESSAAKEAILQLENEPRSAPGLSLRFSYSGTEVNPEDITTSFTRFRNENGKYTFTKCYRDFEWEDVCVKTLGELGFFSDNNTDYYPDSVTGDKKQDFYNFTEAINRNWEELKNSGFRIETSGLYRDINLKPVTIEVSHKYIDDWFDLQAVVVIGEFSFPFIRLRNNILQGRREYTLPDGSVAILPESWFSRYKNIFEFGKDTDNSLRIHKRHFSLLPDAFDENECQDCGDLEKLLVPDSMPSVEPPEGIKAEMRQYQKEGLAWMHWLQLARLGGCLADDMGLGKTIQTIALLQYNKEKTPAGPEKQNISSLFETPVQNLNSLIVVPASLLYNWANEIKRFAPDMKVYSHRGNQRRKSTSYFHHFDIILSSYHTVRQDIDILSLFHFHYIVLDESQVIKNPASMIFKTVIRLKSDYRLVLTGTPVENSLTDLWTQLSFVNPGLLGNLSFFRKEYAKPIEKKKDDDKEVRLRKIIQPFILRRTKEMVANDLPLITEQTVFCDMTEDQGELYEKEKSIVRNSILKSIESAGKEKSSIVVLQGLMKLRQISNHPVLAYENYIAGSGKFEAVLHDMENVISEEHKILVFSSFVKHLDLYAKALTRRRIKFSLLTGASTNREKIVNSFQDNPANRIFLISLKAGGVGLNLTAADYVFILDPWWNPAVEIQAQNRAHRIGQDKNVFVYRYISIDTIEEKITKLQEKKSRLADTFVRSNNPLKDIDLRQILDIIQ
jgi:SNF2 family DNA or RNA helicase